MDHVLEGMEQHYEVLRDWFMKEQREGNYKKLSDNVYYEEIKALISSMNILRKYLGWEKIMLSEEVELFIN